ncbi:hypothetical protein [Dongia sp.]|uniref:hypothetical protein n=1 Tax=Dongia sp. TaxID=1977262 RepID=UPI0035B0BF94
MTRFDFDVIGDAPVLKSRRPDNTAPQRPEVPAVTLPPETVGQPDAAKLRENAA